MEAVHPGTQGLQPQSRPKVEDPPSDQYKPQPSHALGKEPLRQFDREGGRGWGKCM